MRLAAAALLLVPLEVGATTSVLDEFDGPIGGQSVSISNGSNQDDARDVASSTGAVGDTRAIFLLITSNPIGESTVSAEINTLSSVGRLLASQTEAVPRSRVFITYDAGGQGPPPLLDLDLTGFGAVVLEGVHIQGLVSLNMSLDTCCFTRSGYGVTPPEDFVGDVRFDLSRFEGDLSHVTSIDMLLDLGRLGSLGAAASVSIERLGLIPIPEPSTGSLIGAGTAGLALLGARRRRRDPVGRPPRARARS
jgi:hypothetical protein